LTEGRLDTTMSADGRTMTLAFEVAALRQLADPAAVVADARQWSDNVGIVSGQSPSEASVFASDHDISPDFSTGPHDKFETLKKVKARFATERYVLIGVDQEDRVVAMAANWEVLPVEEAASKAEWEFGDVDDDGSLVDTLRTKFDDLF
jgi:hypothetical protein